MLLIGECTIWFYADEFQWAPTLGGECYKNAARYIGDHARVFQWAPTLGGECYEIPSMQAQIQMQRMVSMGTHPWG